VASALRRPLWSPALLLAGTLVAGLAVLLAEAGPAAGPVTITPPTVAPADVIAHRIDINRATQAELEALPGIGERRALAIAAARAAAPFRSVDELATRGVLPVAVLEGLRDLVTAGP
jgi:competence protein ComEA